MKDYERRLLKLEKQRSPMGKPIFLGEAGRFAIVGDYRMGWELFKSRYPKYILINPNDAETSNLPSIEDDGRDIIGIIPKAKKVTKSGKK